MASVIELLCEHLEPITKSRVYGLSNFLMDGIRRAFVLEDERFDLIVKKGWTLERLDRLCDLCSFHRIVLAPLVCSMRVNPANGLGTEIPIIYADIMRFDKERSGHIAEMYRAFHELVKKANVPFHWLQVNYPEDLIREIASTKEREDE